MQKSNCEGINRHQKYIIAQSPMLGGLGRRQASERSFVWWLLGPQAF